MGGGGGDRQKEPASQCASFVETTVVANMIAPEKLFILSHNYQRAANGGSDPSW